MRESVRALAREPVTSLATSACVAVGVAVSAPFLSLVGIEGGWPPAVAPAVRPTPLVGPHGAPALAWSSGATPADALRAADLDALLEVLLAVGLVTLVVAAVAVWVLLAARTRRRGRELRIRAAVGARRADLRRQLRLEGSLLAAGGGLVGALLGAAATQGIRAAAARGLVWADGGSPAMAVLASVAPLVATAAVAPAAVWPGGARRRRAGRGGGSPPPFQDLVVAGAVGALVIVVVAAGLLVRSYAPRVGGAGEEGRASGVAILRLSGAGATPAEPGRAERALDVVARRPEARGQALASRGAWAAQGPVDRVVAQCRCWRGGALVPVVTTRLAHASVGVGFFEALDVEVVEGRSFSPSDRERRGRVAVVDDGFLRVTGGASPVGKWIRVAGTRFSAAGRTDDRYRIVGVVEARRPVGIGARGSARPLVYLPAYLHPAGRPELVVPTRGAAAPAARSLAEAVRAEVPGLRVDAATLEERTGDLAAPLVRAAAGLGGAGGGIVLLAVFGVAGLAADETRRQRPEMAVRRAVGARRRQVVGRVLKRALRLGAGAAVAGLVGAGGMAATLDQLLQGVRVADPVPWAGAVAVVIGSAVAGSLVPALRAAREDPARWLGVRES